MTPDDIARCKNYGQHRHDLQDLGSLIDETSEDMASCIQVMRSWLKTRDPQDPKIIKLFVGRLDDLLMPEVSRFIVSCVRKSQIVNDFFASLPNKKVQQSAEIPKEPQDECVVCMDDVSSATFKPCNHKVTCNLCAQIVFDKFGECPYCRSTIKGMN